MDEHGRALPPGGPSLRIVFVNRYFAPDISATSQILSDLAFHLAGGGHDVHVVCGDALYASEGKRLPAQDVVNGVHVHRVPCGRLRRAGLAGRAVDDLRLHAALRRALKGLLRSGDILVAKTDPPLLPAALAGLARRRGAVFVPWMQDLYPEVAGALGVPLVAGPMGWPLTALRDRSLRRAAAIVAIGEGMRDRLVARGLDAARIRVIPNWADDCEIEPVARDANAMRAEWSLTGKFVVAYSGNLGRAHECDTLLAAAERLRDRADLVFLFVGGGHQIDRLKQEAGARGLEGMFRFEPYQERARLALSLSAPDVHWLSLRPELEGLIVPSKFYGIAAAGRAVLNVGARDGEIARLVERHGCGLTVTPGDGAAMAAAISRMMQDREAVEEMGRRGREMLVAHYSRARAMARWGDLLRGVAR